MSSRDLMEKPVIIGMVGDSGVGKTTMSKGISNILGDENVVVICTDDYHRHSREERAKNGSCPLDPAGNYMDIIENDLKSLSEGRAILKPIYNHDTGNLDRPVYTEPKPYIIVEGLLGYTSKQMRSCYDIKLYLDPEEDLRIAWKMHRDKTKRGYTTQQVLDDLKKREFYSENFIRPQRTFADIIVTLGGYNKDVGLGEQKLYSQNILRPTLPHPDINNEINSKLGEDILFSLSRDIDGKPVDNLKILDSVTESHFDMLLDVLWADIEGKTNIKNRAKDHVKNRDGFGLSTAAVHIMLVPQIIKAAMDLKVV